jgi:hypothetical protein
MIIFNGEITLSTFGWANVIYEDRQYYLFSITYIIIKNISLSGICISDPVSTQLCQNI